MLEDLEDNESASGASGKLTRAKLISSELDGKLKAIAGYDDMLWKIRSGDVAILYGIPAIFLGTEGVPNLKEMMADSVVNPRAGVNDVELMKLLRIAGETSIRGISPDAVKQFWSKMFWNGIFVLFPLYVPAPAIAICIYVIYVLT